MKQKQTPHFEAKVAGYLDDATPIYTIEDVAKELNVSVEEVAYHMRAVNLATNYAHDVGSRKVNLIQ